MFDHLHLAVCITVIISAAVVVRSIAFNTFIFLIVCCFFY